MEQIVRNLIHASLHHVSIMASVISLIPHTNVPVNQVSHVFLYEINLPFHVLT